MTPTRYYLLTERDSSAPLALVRATTPRAAIARYAAQAYRADVARQDDMLAAGRTGLPVLEASEEPEAQGVA